MFARRSFLCTETATGPNKLKVLPGSFGASAPAAVQNSSGFTVPFGHTTSQALRHPQSPGSFELGLEEASTAINHVSENGAKAGPLMPTRTWSVSHAPMGLIMATRLDLIGMVHRRLNGYSPRIVVDTSTIQRNLRAPTLGRRRPMLQVMLMLQARSLT